MKKRHSEIIAGLDIGTSAVRLVVGQRVEREPENVFGEMSILAAAEAPSSGMHKGTITSIEDVVSSVSACLERAERMLGVPIESVWVGISGLHIMSQPSKGVVAVSKADSEIAEEDVARAVEASRAIATPLNYEVLHVLPRSFVIDGQSSIKDPIGMTGIRLEVDSQIILGSSSQIKNLTKAVYRTGLNIEDLVLSILATAEAVVTPRQKELGVVVVNIGMSTTSLAVFEEGDILYTGILPIGSEHITNDIAIGLRTSIDIAEQVKVQYGECQSGEISKREEIDLLELGAQDHEIVKKQYVSEIIEARVEEILHKIDQELGRIKRSGLLPAGVVLTGGGAKLPGLVAAVKTNLRLPAILGYPIHTTGVADKVNDLSYATAVGLVEWGGAMINSGIARGGSMAHKKVVASATAHLRKWIKALLP
ncbi:MAG: cell division protein FtsA [Candidatus Magasanikbacteria bacterium]|nr:cell division protein FtsA [Candidatus Magasanikbacteria bacterium]